MSFKVKKIIHGIVNKGTRALANRINRKSPQKGKIKEVQLVHPKKSRLNRGFEPEQVSIGFDRKNEISIHNPLVSPHQGVIILTDQGRFLYRDLVGRGKTLVDGQVLRWFERVPLQNGSLIELPGGINFRVTTKIDDFINNHRLQLLETTLRRVIFDEISFGLADGRREVRRREISRFSHIHIGRGKNLFEPFEGEERGPLPQHGGVLLPNKNGLVYEHQSPFPVLGGMGIVHMGERVNFHHGYWIEILGVRYDYSVDKETGVHRFRVSRNTIERPFPNLRMEDTSPIGNVEVSFIDPATEGYLTESFADQMAITFGQAPMEVGPNVTHIRVNASSVDPFQGIIYRKNNGFPVYVDQSSSNATINGQQSFYGAEVPLTKDTMIRMGDEVQFLITPFPGAIAIKQISQPKMSDLY